MKARRRPPMRNRGVVFSGRVGQPMRARKRAACRRLFRAVYVCDGGPFHSQRIRLDATCWPATFQFRVREFVGHYRVAPGAPRGAVRWMSA